MNQYKTSEWLYSKNKAGAKKFWRLHILEDAATNKFYISTEWYQITKTGAESTKQTSIPYFAEPTNVGRANERDSKTQAEFEFDALLKKQRDVGFLYENEATVHTRPMPMLAHKFSDHGHKCTYPVWVQPKLNGMRMEFDGIKGWSRGNKDIIPEVIAHLHFPNGRILDGELMLPNNVLLQESMAAIKKFRPQSSPNLIYWVYDIVNEHLTFNERTALLDEMFTWESPPINMKQVPTHLCNNEVEVHQYHKQFVEAGFEGTMVRSPEGKYEIGKRSYSLLKLKDMVDSEFKIVDVVEGGGRETGLAIFVCDNGDGKTFNCRPEGTAESRAAMFNNRKQLVNKFLTVRFQELSRDNIPIFPVGVGIRDLEDFS